MGGLPSLPAAEGKQAVAWNKADTCWTTSYEGQNSMKLRRGENKVSHHRLGNEDRRWQVSAVEMVNDILINTQTDFNC